MRGDPFCEVGYKCPVCTAANDERRRQREATPISGAAEGSPP